MKVYLDNDPMMGGYRIYAYRETPEGVQMYKFGDGWAGLVIGEARPWGEARDPAQALCLLPYEIVDELVAKHKGIRLGEVTEDALRDARAVRDRLLTLVESVWPEPKIEVRRP